MSWDDRAACLGDDKFTERPYSEQRPVCFSCPVQEECLAAAFVTESTRACEVVVRGGLIGVELVGAIRKARGQLLPPRKLWCRTCREPFETRTHGEVLYCSKYCRQKAYIARRGQKAAVA